MIRTLSKYKYLISLILMMTVSAVFFAISACQRANNSSTTNGSGSSSSTYDTTSATVLSSTLAASANFSDSSDSSLVADLRNDPKISPSAYFLKMLFAKDALATSCKPLTSLTCSSNTMSFNLQNCVGSPSLALWSGTLNLTFYTNGTSTSVGSASPDACSRAQSGGLANLINGDQFTITTGTGSTNNVTVKATSGALSGFTVLENSGNAVSTTLLSSGYNIGVLGGTLITCSSAACATRNVHLFGWNRVLQNSSGTTVYNHSLNTSTPFTISGTGSSKQITAGVLIVQHNIALVTATSTVASNIGFSSTSCAPTSGSITTSFDSGTTTSETVSYNSQNISVGGTTFVLGHCF